MKVWMHKIELIVDRIIPYCLIPLLFLIVGEIFFSTQLSPYDFWLNFLDGIIVCIFVLDLIFKYIRARKIPKFLKSCWLDIIAVFPFFLVFRLFEEIGILFNFGERILEAQPIFRETVEIEKEASQIIKESEKIAKVSRTEAIARFFKPLARSQRFLKASLYYERPTGKHHPHERPIKSQHTVQGKSI